MTEKLDQTKTAEVLPLIGISVIVDTAYKNYSNRYDTI